MGFGHERSDVYRAAIDYVGWADHFCEELKTKLGQRGYTIQEETGG